MTSLSYLAMVAGSTAVLAVARVLKPSPTGIGTHEQLGLPPCFFHRLTGWPCPSCGLTTSFAYAARFRFVEAFASQPFGLLLFFLVCLSVPLALALMYRRVPLEQWLHGRWSNPAFYALLTLYVLGWIYKLAV